MQGCKSLLINLITKKHIDETNNFNFYSDHRSWLYDFM